MTLTQSLKDILQKTNKSNCYYVGAGLYIDTAKGYFHIGPNSILRDDSAHLVEGNWDLDFQLSSGQKILAAQIYKEYKTSGHYFYPEVCRFLDREIQGVERCACE